MLGIFQATLATKIRPIRAMSDVLRMISRTAIRHPTMVEAMTTADAGLGKRLLDLAQLAGPGDLAGPLGDAGEAICFRGDGRAIW
jgi:hypothetical protein